MRIEEVEIATVYLDGNTSSHFRPLRDSARIYVPLLGFALSSLVEFVLDAVALLALVSLTGQLTVSAVVARVVSGSANYAINRRLVFGTSRRDSLVRHVALAVAILAVNLVLLKRSGP